jgi:hypothetical protein
MRTTTIVVREVKGPSALTTVSRLGGGDGGSGLDTDRTFWAGRYGQGGVGLRLGLGSSGPYYIIYKDIFLGFKICIDISV